MAVMSEKSAKGTLDRRLLYKSVSKDFCPEQAEWGYMHREEDPHSKVENYFHAWFRVTQGSLVGCRLWGRRVGHD